jgi:hypothetical protein
MAMVATPLPMRLVKARHSLMKRIDANDHGK